MHNSKESNSGFTLIELMVTLAIVGIFATIALPSFSNLIESNRINSKTNELVANLLLTKSEALKRSNSVTLCPSVNQKTCSGTKDYSSGWIVFLDCGVIGQMDTGTIADCGVNNREEVIKVMDESGSIFMSNRNRNFISFNYTGRPAGVSTFDVGADASTLTKEVAINLVGRVRSCTLPC